MIFRTNLVLLLMVFLVTTSFASRDKQTYVIYMDRTKITALDTFEAGNSKRWYETIIDTITELSVQENDQEEETSPPQLLYVYETAITGFSAKLTPKQLESLKSIDGFLHASPDEMLHLHTTLSPSFLGLTRGKGLWKASNLASDVIIGVLDTGVWPEHASFKDKGMSPVPWRWKGTCEEGTKFTTSNCNRKLIGARAYLKGYEGSYGSLNETDAYRSPRDSGGHGTHTASTAAGNVIAGANFLGTANGSAAGMRYTARIAAYKVCWTLGCSGSDILAAIDDAVREGVDVLSLSLGGGSQPYYSDNIAIGTFGAIRKGVFVSCSAGNSGPHRSTVTNSAPWIMTVAASSLDRSFPTTVKLGDGQIFRGASLYFGKPTKQLPLVYGATAGGDGAEFCTDGSLSAELVRGKIVVCEKGEIGRLRKGELVKMAGGAGMIVVNGEDQGEDLLAFAHVLPATSLGELDGRVILSYINSATKPTASIVFKGIEYGNAAPVVAAFSSRGPNFVGPDVIKPDVTAPGVNILAAWPPNISPTQLDSDERSVLFNIVSGTSMSCPHVSGLAALLKAVHRDWSPAAIKSALMTTAYTLDNKKAPIGDLRPGDVKVATPFSFGSGHVDPEKASNPGLVYDITTKDYLNYLCSLHYTSSQMALVSRGDFTCPKDAALQPGDLNYPSFAVLFKGDARNTRVTYKRTVTNVGTPVSTYAVQVVAPNNVSVIVAPRVLKFKKSGQKLTYRTTFVSLEKPPGPSPFYFGSLVWVSRKYTVRSPIVAIWPTD